MFTSPLLTFLAVSHVSIGAIGVLHVHLDIMSVQVVHLAFIIVPRVLLTVIGVPFVLVGVIGGVHDHLVIIKLFIKIRISLTRNCNKMAVDIFTKEYPICIGIIEEEKK